jgi:hypothetical protein
MVTSHWSLTARDDKYYKMKILSQYQALSIVMAVLKFGGLSLNE